MGCQMIHEFRKGETRTQKAHVCRVACTRITYARERHMNRGFPIERPWTARGPLEYILLINTGLIKVFRSKANGAWKKETCPLTI